MNLLNQYSLAKTIDNVSEALLFGNTITVSEKSGIADFILNQHLQPGNYANTFAPTKTDLQEDLVLFTGEKIKSRAGKCHVLGEEASRILRKLSRDSDMVNEILNQADSGLRSRIDESIKSKRYQYGMYCCKSCSCALWLNLSSGGVFNDFKFLKAGINILAEHKDGQGRWKGFPYYYTLYVLNEIPFEISGKELAYAAKTIEEKLFKNFKGYSQYEIRRKYICQQILTKVNRN